MSEAAGGRPPEIEPVLRSGMPVPTHGVAEIEFVVDRDVPDPWRDLRIFADVTDPAGAVHRVPAFWTGGRGWRARYSSGIVGRHVYRLVTEDECGLDGREGVLEVVAYEGSNPLLRHGGPRVADDGRRLAHADGTPFLWLADTWWNGLTRRVTWPATFQRLAEDRAEKGFSVIQIVAGLIPEVVPFSAAMSAEGGQPWTELGSGRINPAFFDVPDRKLDHLVGRGMVPCIVGGWGFFAGIMGRERVLDHWRYLVARYGAYPVVWCVAGEANVGGNWEAMARARETEQPSIVAPGLTHEQILDRIDPHGLDPADPATYRSATARIGTELAAVWEEASEMIARSDPFRRIRTVHPWPGSAYASSGVFRSRGSFDLDMLQTGHTGLACMAETHDALQLALAPGDKPVLNGECSYEGIFDSSWNDVQTFMFWSHLLSGAAGHTYGTMAISCFTGRTDPLVPLTAVSQHDWEDAIDWQGARNVAAGKRILERLAWWTLEPAPHHLEGHADATNRIGPYAARLEDGGLVVYLPNATTVSLGALALVPDHRERVGMASLTGLPPGAYAVVYVDPRTAEERPPVRVEIGEEPVALPARPTGEDWIAIVRAATPVRRPAP